MHRIYPGWQTGDGLQTSSRVSGVPALRVHEQQDASKGTDALAGSTPLVSHLQGLLQVSAAVSPSFLRAKVMDMRKWKISASGWVFSLPPIPAETGYKLTLK